MFRYVKTAFPILLFLIVLAILSNFPQFVGTDGLYFIYFLTAFLIPIAIISIIGEIIKEKKIKSRHGFEYIFFVSLFVSTSALTIGIGLYQIKNFPQFLHQMWWVMVFYGIAIMSGWLHYIDEIHSPACNEDSHDSIFRLGKGTIGFMIFTILIILLLIISIFYSNAIWIWTALSAVGTLSLAFLVVYKDILRQPEIEMVFEQLEPFCRAGKTPVTKQGTPAVILTDGYWIRIKIINKGKTAANNCEGRLTEIQHGDGSLFQPFDPVVLHWVGRKDFSRININSQDYEYLDVIYTLDGYDEAIINCGESMSLSSLPPRGIDTRLSPAPYIIKIRISSGNAKSISKEYLIEWNGIWNEIKMSEM